MDFIVSDMSQKQEVEQLSELEGSSKGLAFAAREISICVIANLGGVLLCSLSGKYFQKILSFISKEKISLGKKK